MKKITSIIAIAAFVAVSVAGMTGVSAQTMSTMPTLYNQYGAAVNVASNVSLVAGWYYLAPGAAPANQVYYYGNGTYYQASTGTYGGSVGDPYGTANVSLSYVSPVGTPGLPNTGAGGGFVLAWSILFLSGLVTAAGIVYLVKARQGLVPKLQ